MDDGGERVEEREAVLAGFRADSRGEQGRGEWAGRDDRGAVWQGINAFAHERDVGVRRNGPGHARRKRIAVHRQRRPGRDAVPVGLTHDDRAERPHLLMQQPDGVGFGIVRAEAVRADKFGKAVGAVRRRAIPAAAHFGQAHLVPRLGELPCGFGPGHATADDVNVVSHPTNFERKFTLRPPFMCELSRWRVGREELQRKRCGLVIVVHYDRWQCVGQREIAPPAIPAKAGIELPPFILRVFALNRVTLTRPAQRCDRGQTALCMLFC